MMKKIQDYSLIAVFVMTAILAAVVGLKAYSGYMRNKAEEEALFQQRKEEILARNAEAQNRVQEMQVEIIEMQNDVEALQTFIDDTVNAANEVQNRKAEGNLSGNGSTSSADSASGETVPVQSDAVSGNGVPGQPGFDGSVSGNDGTDFWGNVSGNEGFDGSVSGNDGTGFGGNVSGNEGFDGSVSENDGMDFWGNVSGNEGFDGSVSENDGTGFWGNVSGNEGFDGSLSGNGGWSVSGNSISENRDMIPADGPDGANQPDGQPEMTLEERKQWRTSYQETMEVNQADREWIAENQYDFSQMKIACLGDSITKAANLEGEENYEQYAYPARLQELLGAEEVYNLGIGGSSIGRYWADAFVDRYTEIPQDSDIIIVMGGTNDGFCVSEEEFGSLDERAYHTFCGDLNELMNGLRENYPDAQIFFATPLPNVLQDYLMSEREYLLPQKDFVEVIQTLADEYDFEVIDLYNSNVLDSHDANIITEYMPDGVHGNPAGYQILAERFAGELVKYYNEEETETTQENAAGVGTSPENSVPGAGTGLGTGAGGNTGTGTTAVGGNAGAGAGVITIVGGNTGTGSDGGTENVSGGTDSENGAENDSGTGNEENDESDGNDSQREENGTTDGGSSGGTGTGGETGTNTGNGGSGGAGENGADVGSGGSGESGASAGSGGNGEIGINGGSVGGGDNGRNAGFDTGTGAGEKNDAGSERKQYRYEY